MARRYRSSANNKTKEKSLYVEDNIYAEPHNEEDTDKTVEQSFDSHAIYQKPEEVSDEVDEYEDDDEEEDEDTGKKKGIFGLFHRKKREEEYDEDDDEDDDDEDDDDEEEDEYDDDDDDEDDDDEGVERKGFFSRFKRNKDSDNDDEDDDDEDEYDDDEDDAGYEEEDEEEEEKKKRNRKIIAIAGVAAIVVIGAVVFIVRGLSSGSEGEAYVEPVTTISSLGSSNGINNRYTGEVEPQKSWKISLENDLSVEKCYVQVGDIVKKGDKLFKYDTEELQLSYERQELEIETVNNENTQLTKDIATYQNDAKTANAGEKIALQTQILTAQTQIKKNEFNLKSAKENLKKIKAKIKDATVKSKMDGVIKSINEKLGQGSTSSNSDDGTGSDSTGDNTYMTVLATGDFRVKGVINESNVLLINEGDPVIVRSRVNDDTWTGTISQIKTDTTTDSENNNNSDMMDYTDGNSGESTSNYNFYVTLSGDDGLMMGQHVFIELDNGQDEQKEGIWIPSAYLNIDADKYYVWKDSNGKLKKTKVEVGEYNEVLDEYQVTSGIDEDDYIACDDVSLEQNMKTTKTEPKETKEQQGVEENGTDGTAGDELENQEINNDGTVG